MNEQQLIDEGYESGKKSFDYVWRTTLEFFDFERVHKTMKALEWCWQIGKDNMGIPDLNTIKLTARSLMKSAYDEGNAHATGGFIAGWENGEMYLVFQVEEFSVS